MATLAPAGGFNTDASTELALHDNADNAAKVMARIKESITGILLEPGAFLDFCRSCEGSLGTCFDEHLRC
jgi:hypothetical protein